MSNYHHKDESFWNESLGGDFLYVMPSFLCSMTEHGLRYQYAPCRNCSSAVSVTAVECSHCGFRASSGNHVTEIVYLLVGNLLTLTIIGGLVGIPLMLYALHRLRRRSQEVVVGQKV